MHLAHFQAFAGMGATLLGAGGGIETTGSGISNILSAVQERERHKRASDTIGGNVNSGDITYSSGNMDIPLYKMTIRSEYASIIDSYFDMFGYQVNTVKVPNSNHRANWWYTKTIDVNITGAIPNEDLEKIKSCYNNGITFWKDPTKIYDYSQSNAIVS